MAAGAVLRGSSRIAWLARFCAGCSWTMKRCSCCTQQRRLHAVEGQALDGLLEQGVVAGKGEELLGVLLAGKRPESRAAATGKDYWDHVVSPGCVCLGIRRAADIPGSTEPR